MNRNPEGMTEIYVTSSRFAFKFNELSIIITSLRDFLKGFEHFRSPDCITASANPRFACYNNQNILLLIQPYIYNIEKINKNGVRLWQANAPGMGNDLLAGIARFKPNSYLLGGSTDGLNDDYQVYLVGITDTTGKTVLYQKVCC
jgi:hypothetical protein